jgi:hypothetical protein
MDSKVLVWHAFSLDSPIEKQSNEWVFKKVLISCILLNNPFTLLYPTFIPLQKVGIVSYSNNVDKLKE